MKPCTYSRLIPTTLAALFAMALSTPVLAQIRVGEHHPIEIETPRDYASVTGEVWSTVISHPGASYIAVHFVDFDLAPGDYLRVSDAEGGQSYTLKGHGRMNAGTFWARHVKGDTVVLTLVANSVGGRGFTIDEYAAGFPGVNFAPPGDSGEAICGVDDKENAVCYQGSHPTEYDRARAVARLLIQGSSLCTGWLVSAQNHLVTNEHCITSQTAAINTDYEFMAEASGCGDFNCQLCHPGTIFAGGNLIQDNANLDYALVQITSGNPAATFGFLEVDDRVAVPGEEIYIPQHPGGRAKELGIESTHPADTGGVCRVLSVTEPACGGSGYSDVGYYCDTEGGSSGSPVLARSSHKVIALHHCANCPNRGVPIDLVWDEIGPIVSAGPGGSVTGQAGYLAVCRNLRTSEVAFDPDVPFNQDYQCSLGDVETGDVILNIIYGIAE